MILSENNVLNSPPQFDFYYHLVCCTIFAQILIQDSLRDLSLPQAGTMHSHSSHKLDCGGLSMLKIA